MISPKKLIRERHKKLKYQIFFKALKLRPTLLRLGALSKKISWMRSLMKLISYANKIQRNIKQAKKLSTQREICRSMELRKKWKPG
jgi:hypothetical protein